jgi:bzd-type benzoyl-CoA reductase N subunit
MRNKANNFAEQNKDHSKILGYYCCYVPVEIFTAAGIIPYRIVGDSKEQITEADAVLERVICPWVRNTFDRTLKGHYSFLDGVVIPHTCDAVQRMYALWRHYSGLAYHYQFDIPHILSSSAFHFFTEELNLFKSNLEDFIGKKISDAALKEAIELHNENRKLVKELYSLRKPDPPLISGLEALELITKGLTGVPVTAFNEMLKSKIAECKNRQPREGESQPRLMVSGCVIDMIDNFALIENCNAHIVMDDLAIGTRSFWFQVKPGSNPMASLSHAYLASIRCPRTISGKKIGNYKEEFEDRWGYLRHYAEEYGVQGIILTLLRFCDAHEYDFIDLKNYLNEIGLPVLVLDDDYTLGSIPRVKTRIEAFVEMLQMHNQD